MIELAVIEIGKNLEELIFGVVGLAVAAIVVVAFLYFMFRGE